MVGRKLQVVLKKSRVPLRQPKLALVFVLVLILFAVVHDKLTNTREANSNTPEQHTIKEPDRTFDVPEFLKPALRKSRPLEYEEGVIKVEIMAYKRGGSSFMGELFNRNSKAWYYFEPISFMMSKVIPEKLRFDWHKIENTNYVGLESSYRIYIKHLSALLNCTISDLALEYYLAGAAGTKPPKFFNPPLFVHKSYRLNDALGNGLSTPFFVQKTCHQYTIRAAKTIRVQHAIALEKFLDKDVWVIHLVRDPRAIIVSRKLATGPGNLCRLMATNLKRSLKLQASGRKCINVRYEDVALYPLESAADIYETLGIELSTELMRWIEQNTEHTAAKRFPNKVKRGLDLGTTRNSTDAAFHWIKDISPEMAQKFDNDVHCQYIYNLMNYQNYSIMTTSPIKALFPNYHNKI